MSESLRDLIARAMVDVYARHTFSEEANKDIVPADLEAADATLAAIEAAGYAVVPLEPTEEMSRAGFRVNVFKNYHNGEPGCPGVVCPIAPPDDWLAPENAEAVKAYLAAPKCMVARATIPAEPAYRAMIAVRPKP